MVDFRNEPSCGQFRTVLGLAATSFPYFLKKLLKKSQKLLSAMCSSRKYPEPLRSATEIPRGGEGGPKGDNFQGGGGLLTEVFPGGLSNIGELLINNSFSVEQSIRYFTVTGVSKQVLLFALILFYPRSCHLRRLS